MSDWTSDRLVGPGEPDPGGTVEVELGASGPVLDSGEEQPLVDSEGNVVRELDLDRPDELAAGSATVRQLAVDEQVWRFGHVIVDEAQDLTPMQWRMVVRRSRKGAVTILGDLAQRSIGGPGNWVNHLPAAYEHHDQRNLTINYRSPGEINELASAVLDRLAPGLPQSRAVRRSGQVPEAVRVSDIGRELPGVLSERAVTSGRSGDIQSAVGVIGFDLPDLNDVAPAGGGRFRVLSPWQAKGLEFDAVAVVEPARFLEEPHGLALLYVALTRATDRLVIVHQRDLPELLTAGDALHQTTAGRSSGRSL